MKTMAGGIIVKSYKEGQEWLFKMAETAPSDSRLEFKNKTLKIIMTNKVGKFRYEFYKYELEPLILPRK
jgi:hypothetical protein